MNRQIDKEIDRQIYIQIDKEIYRKRSIWTDSKKR